MGRAEHPYGESSVELVRLARAGNRQAIDQLLSRYFPVLRRWTAGRLPRWARDMVDTEDMVQDALIGTVKHLDHFKPEHDGALLAYMRRALANRIQDELRKAHRRPARDEASESIPSVSASALEEAIGREAFDRYEAALGRLDETDREAILCRIEMGMSYAEVAQVLGKSSADGARMKVSRALVRLAREMGDEQV